MHEITVIDPLSNKEEADLARLESVIKENFLGFVAVGNALTEIRDRRLYRDNQDRTFEGYCVEMWDICRRHADRLIGASSAVQNIETNWSQKGVQVADIPLPQNEAQARELALLEPDEQVQVWKNVVEKAGGKSITARMVKHQRIEFKGEKLEKKIRTSTGAAGKKKIERMSDSFLEAWDKLWDQVDKERQDGWKATSREAVHKQTSILLEALSEAGSRQLKTPDIAMELSDREKLLSAGFRIYRMHPNNKIIEIWDRSIGWMVADTAESSTELLEKFKAILSDPKNLKA